MNVEHPPVMEQMLELADLTAIIAEKSVVMERGLVGDLGNIEGQYLAMVQRLENIREILK